MYRLPLIVLFTCAAAAAVSAADDASHASLALQLGAPVSCADVATRVNRACGGSESALLEECEFARAEHEPMGCGAAVAARFGCYAQVPVDCSPDHLQCAATDAPALCAIQFEQRTGCARRTLQDARCPIDSYAFSCGAQLPEACSALADGAAHPLACCASFDEQGGAFSD